jgi:hypothetical protein
MALTEPVLMPHASASSTRDIPGFPWMSVRTFSSAGECFFDRGRTVAGVVVGM